MPRHRRCACSWVISALCVVTIITFLVTTEGESSGEVTSVTQRSTDFAPPLRWISENFHGPPTHVPQEACGWGTMKAFNITVKGKRVGPLSFELDFFSSNTTAIWVTGRALGKTIFSATISSGAVKTLYHRQILVSFEPILAGTYEVDIVATWVDDRYMGQPWRLPNRNDNPTFDEKRRKCLSLELRGKGCDRFGVILFDGEVRIDQVAKDSFPTCVWSRKGEWREVNNSSSLSLIDDAVGLNRLRGKVWEWFVPGCPPVLQSVDSVLFTFRVKHIERVALIGDSMLVEMFNALHQWIAPNAAVAHGRVRKLRTMEFRVSDRLQVKFFRSYTTAGGQSVLANPRIIIDQLRTFAPDIVLGNLAVLHWQQNMRGVSEWYVNLREFSTLFNATFPKLVAYRRGFYLGPTLIQMGRTQGLQPSRTLEFARAARQALSDVMHFVDVYNMSVPRREAAFDGQHWACYHQFGGVSQVLLQLALRQILQTAL